MASKANMPKKKLKAYETRVAYYAHELPDDVIEALENVDLSHLPDGEDDAGPSRE